MPIIGIIGSARIEAQDPYCEIARAIGKGLSDRGYAVMTGSGGGIMRAANEGAHRGQGLSVGLGVKAFDEAGANAYLDRYFCLDRLALRKQAFNEACVAVICFPGGFGTLDEISDILVTNQYRARRHPIILVGSDFWQPALDWFRHQMLEKGLVDSADLDLPLVDDVASILKRLNP